MGARIYRKIENNMQWGRANGKGWILEHDAPQYVRPDPLTGWAGGGDTQAQVRLSFPTLERAIAYADREGIDYEVEQDPPTRSLKLRTYADNFTAPVRR